MRVAVVGASGLIGGALARALTARGDEVLAVSRSGAAGVPGAEDVRWDPVEGPPPDAVTAADAVVNLAGAPIARRWTAAHRRAIHDSRVVPTRALATRVGGEGGAPVLVNASAVGYYGPAGDAVLDESAPPGADFLAEVAEAWERATEPAAARGARVVRVRTGLVLSGAGGILTPLARLTRLGLAGPVGGGRQWMPWIHIDDEVAVLLRAIDDDGLAGPVNAVGPDPVPQRRFMETLGRVLGRPAVVPAPAWAVRAAMGEMATLALDGQRAVPAALTRRGFTFAHPGLEGALRAALGR